LLCTLSLMLFSVAQFLWFTVYNALNTHGVEVSASCSCTCCPGMRITVDVVLGMQPGMADLLRAGGLSEDWPGAEWFAVTQSTASDINFMLL